MAKEGILEYAANSPLLAETKKPQIMHIQHTKYGVRKLRSRVKMNRKGPKHG